MAPSSGGSRRDPEMGRPPDPALGRGLTERRIGRRRFLSLSGLAAGGLVSGALAGCGASAPHRSSKPLPALPHIDAAEFWQNRGPTGTLDFANWPLYIDTVPGHPNDHPTLDQFTKQTGVKVDYRQVIQDTDSFYAKIAPALAVGAPIGYDLMVFTNDQTLADLIRLNYLAPLDRAKLPTFYANADQAVLDPPYDPGNAHTVAWQSGITGIAYHPGRLGGDVSSFADLFNPAFTGHIGMFGDSRDLPNFTLVGMGIEPETSKPSDWHKAAAKLRKQRSDGLVRAYYQQDYIRALVKGDLWISMAWSGDIYQANAQGAGLKFVVPSEGGLLWTDNLCIPVTASHPVEAIAYMDFVYRTDVAAKLAESIHYIPPVPFSRGQVLADAGRATGPDAETLRALADSPLTYPSQADLDRLSRYRVLAPDEVNEWNRIFQPVYT
ncbi:MAG: extracellular solute-binding protein [Frankia sp.]